MSYVQIHKTRALILLALMVLILCGWVLFRSSRSSIFSSCAQATVAGRRNIPKSDSAYNPVLDRNKNGYACE